MNKNESLLRKLLQDKEILLLDGATGTVMTAAGMPKGVCTEQWILEHPDLIVKLQEDYIRAGSRIVYAPTFGANRHRLKAFGLEGQLREMNLRLADLSRKAAGGRAFVGGDLSPTGLLPESAGGDASVEQIFEIYREQAQALKEAGVDLFAVETMMSVDETVIALDAVRSVSDAPVFCSFSCYADGKNYYDGTVFDAAPILEEMGADAVGINCGSGPAQIESQVRSLASSCSIPIIAKPNAGMPVIDEQGRAVYDLDEESFAAGILSLMRAGASIVGGCCGTTPAYIKRTAEAIEAASGS